MGPLAFPDSQITQRNGCVSVCVGPCKGNVPGVRFFSISVKFRNISGSIFIYVSVCVCVSGMAVSVSVSRRLCTDSQLESDLIVCHGE